MDARPTRSPARRAPQGAGSRPGGATRKFAVSRRRNHKAISLWRPYFQPMNENGNRYTVAALRERRAALDGEIKEYERKLRFLRVAIGHVDATISLFDPNGNPKKITAKRPTSASSCSLAAISGASC